MATISGACNLIMACAVKKKVALAHISPVELLAQETVLQYVDVTG